eukprot:5934153-Amphidinium_carterae.2
MSKAVIYIASPLLKLHADRGVRKILIKYRQADINLQACRTLTSNRQVNSMFNIGSGYKLSKSSPL